MKLVRFLATRLITLASAIIALSALSAYAASASTVFSAPGNGVCNLFGGGSCTLQQITPNGAWQPNVPGIPSAVWVSYANTGNSGPNLTFPPVSANYLMQVTETINVSPVNNVILNLKVWADDTVGVILNGNQIFAPNTSQNICANGPIGCQPNEGGNFNLLLLAGSSNTISFQAYQTGGGPFGLLYGGSTTEAPEPTTLALIVVALASMAMFAMARQRAGI